MDEPKDKVEAPAPEVLQAKDEEAAPVAAGSEATPASSSSAPSTPIPTKSARRATYRPSHKATFLGLGVVAVILAVNAIVIAFVLRNQTTTGGTTDQSTVTLSTETLSKLGVSRNSVGDLGTELVVNPMSKFNNSVIMAKDVSIAGELKLNSRLTASDAAFSKLQAGDTSVDKLNINGDATVSNLNLRKDLTVTGVTRLQGPVTLSQLLTVNNSLNVSGSLAVGGTLSVRSLSVGSFTTDTTLTIGGHVITRGSAPGVGAGSAVGSNGTVSISGNDAAGTVAVNIGVGASAGTLAQISFNSQFGSTPHVIITPIGRSADVYVNRTSSGFSINAGSGLSPGGYAFDYVIMQ